MVSNTNTVIKPSHRGSCYDFHLREKQSCFWNTGVQHQENMTTRSGAQTLFTEPFLQTEFQGEAKGMKNKKVKVMMKLRQMSVEVLLCGEELYISNQQCITRSESERLLKEQNIYVSSQSNFQHVLICFLCSVAISHLFCPLFSCYEICVTY